MISRLKLMDFRCYGSFSWQIPQQGAIILGNNAQGKTSLLEAVCFLLRLQSPRTARPGPLAAHGKQAFGIRGELPGQARRILWTPDAPDLRVNGEPRKDQRSYLADSYPVVWMGNDDLSLVQAGADARRKYMDFLGSQWHPGYRLALFSYRRALKTRNYLLKHRHRDKLQLDAYTRQLALHGTELKSLRAPSFPCPMISRLKLMDFRCYGSFSWQIPQQGAIILGNNAQGKTSLLEAVCFLLRLQSPRTARPGPLAAHGKQAFGIRGELPGQARRILWTPDAPDLRVNGEPRKDQRSYLADSYPVVWMGNDDLSLVQAGADARRKYMDFLGSQWHPGYRLALFSYRRALKTRNYLLKHRHRDKLQLDAYTRQLALHGTELKSLRASLLTLLAPHITLAYRSIGGREEQVAVAYRASEEGDLYERLCAAVDRDIRYGQTQNGPHRDDLDITLNGRSAAQFASEGQQRTIAISMKLAQSSLLTEETGHTPIHLIDDVFGELDPTRRVAFLQSLPADAQSLITTTHLDWLHDTPCPLPSFRLEDSTLKPL